MRILAIADVEEGWLYDHWDAERVAGVIPVDPSTVLLKDTSR